MSEDTSEFCTIAVKICYKEIKPVNTNTLQPTDYRSLSVETQALIEEASVGDYPACVTSLLGMMRKQFPSLTQEHNPVSVNIGAWTQSDLNFIIREYSGFSNAAIHMFLEARIRNHWPTLTKEIIHNMDEEMGALTSGIPHLELMRHGYRVELGIETDNLHHSAVTRDFIDRMITLFRSRDNMFLAGVLLAFEGTAVDEFRIVDRMLRRYKDITGGEIAVESLTGQYIAGHVAPGTDAAQDPEMDHYRGMVDAVGSNVTSGNLQPLAAGFFSVCLELNRWWELIALETFHEKIRDRVAQGRTETNEIYRSLCQISGFAAGSFEPQSVT